MRCGAGDGGLSGTARGGQILVFGCWNHKGEVDGDPQCPSNCIQLAYGDVVPAALDGGNVRSGHSQAPGQFNLRQAEISPGLPNARANELREQR